MTKTTYVVVGAPGSPFIHGNRSHAEAHAEAERDAQRSAIANGTVERDAYGFPLYPVESIHVQTVERF